jgi:hypothetical protein
MTLRLVLPAGKGCTFDLTALKSSFRKLRKSFFLPEDAVLLTTPLEMIGEKSPLLFKYGE